MSFEAAMAQKQVDLVVGVDFGMTCTGDVGVQFMKRIKTDPVRCGVFES